MIVLRGPGGLVTSLEFSPDGRSLVARPEFEAQFYPEVKAGVCPVRLEQYAHPPRFSPDGRHVLWVWDEDLHSYEIATQQTRRVTIGDGLSIHFNFSTDGRYVLLAHKSDRFRGWLSLCPLDDVAKPRWAIKFPWLSWQPAYFISNDWIVTFEERTKPSASYVIVLRRASDGEAVIECADRTEFYGGWALSSDRRLLAGLRTTQLAVYRTDDFSAPCVHIDNDTRKHFTGLAFHPSGRFLAATSNDNTVKLYDTQTWRLSQAFDWNVGRLRSVAFSPDGMLAAAGGDRGKVVVWDVDL